MDTWFTINTGLCLLIIAVSSLYNLLKPQKLSVHYRLGFFGVAIFLSAVLVLLLRYSPSLTHTWVYPFMIFLWWESGALYISFLIDFTSSPRPRFFRFVFLVPIVITAVTLVLPGAVSRMAWIVLIFIFLFLFTFGLFYRWTISASDFRAKRDAEWMVMIFAVFAIGFVISLFWTFTGVLWVLSLWFLVLHIIVNVLNLLEEITGQENLVVMDTVFDIVVILDASGHIIRMNRRGHQITNYSSLRVRGSGIEDLFIHPDLNASRRVQWLIRHCWKGSIVGGGNSPSIDAWISADSGEEIPVDLRVISLQDLRKRRTGFIISATDMRITRQLMKEITDREYAARGLARSESKFSRMFIFNPSGILIVDLETSTITDANPALEEILETSVSELVGKDLSIIGLNMGDMSIPVFLEKVSMEGSVPEFSAQIIQPGLSVRFCRVSAVSFDLNHSRRMLLSLTDVSKQVQMLEALTRKQKVETIGVLAGGIAHDFNNILAVILGHIGLAKVRVLDKDVAVPLEKAEKACLRARELTGQLLAFSRGGSPVILSCTIRSLVVDSAMIAVENTNVSCLFNINSDVWAVKADRIQLGQVITNLVGNAVEAMDGRGIIEITVENADLNNAFPRQRPIGADSLPVPPGSYIKIQIQDQGPGIPDSVMQKIFDPFFTTKENGTGMGLSIVFSVIQNHGGSVSVDSNSKGSKFTFYIPADPLYRESEDAEMLCHLSAGMRVLLMDDDVLVLETATGMLSLLGYEVTQSKKGEEALSIYTEAFKNAEPFSFCVLDQVIPGGMSGSDCAREILRVDPNASLLLSSGYSDDPVLARYQDYGFCGVIKKPYTLEELRQALSNVLVS